MNKKLYLYICLCLWLFIFSKDTFAEENKKVFTFTYENGSEFYKEPYGVMASFDEDNSNYTAAYNDSFPNWFIVNIGQSVLVENVQIEWYSNTDYASDFEIFGYVNDKWVLLAKETDYKIGINTVIYKKNIKEPLNINKIKMVVKNTNGQQRLLMRKFELNTDSYGKSYESVREVVNEILSDRFENVSPHQKIVLFMDWMDDNIRPELGKADAIYTINHKTGACGTLSQLLISMAYEVGLEARPINLYNYPKPGLGHSLVEIKWDNKWHLYDPTYQAYYLIKGDDLSNHIDPDVASFDDVRNNPQLVDKNRVILNVKRLYRGFSVVREDGSRVLDHRGIYTSSDAYKKSFPAGPIGPDNQMVFPAIFNLDQNTYQYGEKDFQNKDMGDIYKVPAGLYMLGVSYHNVNHNYIINNLVKGSLYEVELGITYSSPAVFELTIKGNEINILNSNSVNINQETNERVVKIQFIAEKNMGSIFLGHNYKDRKYLLLLDYIKISKVK